jgi:hypothetical protein
MFDQARRKGMSNGDRGSLPDNALAYTTLLLWDNCG